LAEIKSHREFQYTEQYHRRGDICPVGIADRDQRVLIETMLLAATETKLRVRVPRDNSFSSKRPQPAAEKIAGTVFQNFFLAD